MNINRFQQFKLLATLVLFVILGGCAKEPTNFTQIELKSESETEIKTEINNILIKEVEIGEYKIFNNGKQVEGYNGNPVQIVKGWRNNISEVYLLRIGGMGTSCDALFTILTIRNGKATIDGGNAKKQFGTCSDIFSFKENSTNLIITIHPNDEEAKSYVAVYDKKTSKITNLWDELDKEYLADLEKKMKQIPFYQHSGINGCVVSTPAEYIKSLEILQRKYKVIDVRKIGSTVMEVNVIVYDDLGLNGMRTTFIRGKEDCESSYEEIKNESAAKQNERISNIKNKYQ